MRPWLEAESGSTEGALVSMHNGTLRAFSEATGYFGESADYWVFGISATDDVVIVIDPVFNFALQPVDYTLDLYSPGAVALPEDGSTATIVPGRYGTGYAYFEVDDNEVVNLLLHHSTSPPAG